MNFSPKSRLAAGSSAMLSRWMSQDTVQSIQSGTITITSGNVTNTATITAVDTSRSVVTFVGTLGANAASSEADLKCTITLTDATTVTATRRGAAGQDVVVGYNVVQYRPGVYKSIQRATITITAGNLTSTATIVSVNTARTRLEFLGYSDDSGNVEDIFQRVSVTNATTITATRGANGGSAICIIQTVESW